MVNYNKFLLVNGVLGWFCGMEWKKKADIDGRKCSKFLKKINNFLTDNLIKFDDKDHKIKTS